MRSIDFKVEPGTHVEDAVKMVRKLYEEHECNVTCMFNFLPLSLYKTIEDERSDDNILEMHRDKDKEHLDFGDIQIEGAQ